MRPAIRVEYLSKQYRIGDRASYRTLRESLVQAWHRVGKLLRGRSEPGHHIWALRDIDFDVQPGEIVGIIGRNGAGKSTLLKVLSRITEPTAGRVELRGRIGSLLEVGTGFHPELTGRENVFLNGAILGMTRREIARKFDDIVAFAAVDAFLDTPVKRYSSGMRMRLAFAVAAHFHPEILLVDEVLAVGDLAFQRKCLKKIEEIGTQGSTVLFVSHNMNAVARLCPRAILIDEGSIRCDGPTADVVAEYLRGGLGLSRERAWNDSSAPGDDVARLRAVRVLADGRQIDTRESVAVEMEFDVLQPGKVLVPGLQFVTEDGIVAFVLNDLDPEWRGRPRPVGRYRSRACLPGNLLAEGTLVVGAMIYSQHPHLVHVQEREVVAFQVVDRLDDAAARGDYAGSMPGVVRPLIPWTTEFTRAA